ncbi:MAG: divalent-cation tolerance protein CutA [Thermodesulfobacteriota bacterium]
MSHNANWVYMTAGSKDEAVAVGEALIEAGLAACVNIIDSMNSIFMWEGRVEQDTETVLIAKTTAERVPELVEKVKSVHSYECPCIVSLPIADGNPAFIDWIAEQVRR